MQYEYTFPASREQKNRRSEVMGGVSARETGRQTRLLDFASNTSSIAGLGA